MRDRKFKAVRHNIPADKCKSFVSFRRQASRLIGPGHKREFKREHVGRIDPRLLAIKATIFIRYLRQLAG